MRTQLKRWILGLGLFCLCLTTITAQTSFVVSNSNNAGTGSLRAAIYRANALTTNSVITFRSDITVVNLTDSIRIRNVNAPTRFITINGGGDVRVRSNTTTRTIRGLGLTTGAAIYGLQFENFSTAIDVSAEFCTIGGIGNTTSNVFLNNANAIVSTQPINIIGNFIGTNRTGTTVNGNSSGITIQTLSSNSISGPTISNNTFLGTDNIALTLLLNSGATVSNNIFGKNGTGFGNETGVYLLGGSMNLTENRFENNDKAVTITSSDDVIFRDNTYLCNRGTSLITYSSAYPRPTISSATYLHNGSVVLSGTSPAAGDSVEVYETFSTACAGTTPCQGFKQTRVASNSSRNWFATVKPTSGKTFFANASRVIIGPGFVASSLPPFVSHSSLFTACEVPDCPTLIVTFTKVNDVNCYGGNDGRATVSINVPQTAGGTFRYYVAETELNNPTYAPITSSVTVQNLQSRTYTAFVENTLTGCKYKSVPLSIGQPSAPLSLTNCREVTPTSTANPTDGIGEVTVGGGIGPYSLTYQRTGGTPTTISVATASIQRLTGLAAGTYTVIVTDKNHAAGNPKTGCTDTCTFTITPPTCSDLSLTVQQVTNVLCFGNSTGSIQVQYNDLPANLPLTLKLTQGQADLRTIQITTLTAPRTHTFSNLPAGTYTISLSRGSVCTVTRTRSISQPNIPLSITCQNPVNAARVGEASGSADVAISGGVAPYQLNVTGGVIRTYTVSSTAAPFPIPNLPRGNYNVLVTDANNCTQTCNFTINDPDCTGFDVVATAVPVSCFGDNNGQVQLRTANGQAPFTYTWSLASIGNRDFANNLAADTYRITVTDDRLCRDTVGTRVNTPPLFRAVVTPTNIQTSGGNGSIKILVSGGTRDYDAELILNTVSRPPMRHVLDTFFFDNLTKGTYTYRVWDANDCDTTGTVTLTDSDCNIKAVAIPITCKNANDGKIRTSRTNGTAPFSYTWSIAGLTADSAANLRAGNYWVAIRDGLGCTDTAFTIITEPDSLYSLPQVSDVTQVNGNNGSIRITVIGGTAPFTVRLQNGTFATQISNNTFIFNGLTRGTYTYTVTDASGCRGTETVIINDPVCGITVRIQTDSVRCNGGNNGQIRLTIGNANAPLSIRWSNGIPNDLQTVENLRAGTYSFSITDNSGCTKDSTATVSEPLRLTSTFDTTKVTRVGFSDGTITVLVNGGKPPFTVKIGNDTTATTLNATTFRFSNLAVGTYTYVVTDANGCTMSQTVTIEGPNCNLTITPQATAVLCNGDSNGRITLTATGGTGTPTVVWSDGSNANSLTANNLRAGSYSATVTYPNGCSATANATVSTPSVLISNFRTIPITQTSPPNGGVAIGVSGGTAPYSITLNGTTLSVAASDSARFSNLAAGNYTYTIRDNNGCTTTGTFTISPISCNLTLTAQATAVLCNGDSNGRIVLTATGGTGTPTVVWSDGSNANSLTANNLRAGSYSATVTYPNGCSATATATVSTPSVLISNFRTIPITQTSPPNGGVVIGISGGTAPYSVTLNGTTLSVAAGDSARFSNLAAGNYTYTVRDFNGCTTTGTFTISPISCNLTLTAQATAVLCNGDSNGRIVLTATGETGTPTVVWSNGSNANLLIANNLRAGSYSATVTYPNGCSATANATVSTPSVLISNFRIIPITQTSPPNGGVAIGVSGGTARYSVTLNGATLSVAAGDSARFSNLAAGNYTYTVRDFNGCTTTGTFTISPISCNLTLSAQATAVLCNGDSNGRITLTATGGTGTPTVVWSDGSNANSLTANNLSTGNYSATVTYPNGCSATATATVSTPSVLISNFRTIPITQTSPPNGGVAIGVSGGTARYSVTLNGTTLSVAAGDSARFSNLAAGSYTYTVRDFNGCTTTGTFTISPISCNLTITAQATAVLCNGDSNGRITLTATGGTGTPTVVWSDGSNANSLTANNLRAGSYSATVTYPNGCSATANATVSTPSVLISNFRTIPITQTSPPNGGVVIGISGGTAPYSVTLNGTTLSVAAGDSARFSNLAAGNYTYTVRDNNGCTTTGTFTISPLGCNLSAPISVSISRDSVCSGASVTLTTPSVNQAVLYRWQTPVGVTTTSAPNLTLSNLTNSNSGFYTLILSFNGCESPPSPSVRLTVVDVLNQRVFAGLDKTECGNTTTALTASPLINTNFTGNWQSLNAGVIAQNNQSSTAVSGLKSGNNGFVWSVSSSVCGLVGRDTMIVYVEKMPILTETTLSLDSKSSSLLVNMRELLRDSFNFRITITPPSQGFAQIQNQRFLFFDRANLTAAQRIEIPYRLCGLQCPNLCADSKLIIDVAESELDSQELEVQKLLSSNGSTSPFLEIKGLELLDEVECIIVDRWGTRVFGPVSYQNNTVGRAWDGTKNGKQLPNGAYYYSLRYTNKATKRVQRGIIYLLDGL